jgi:hypothetical protein
MADYTPVSSGGQTPFTLAAGGTIAGGQPVGVSADGTVIAGTAATKAKIIGIAANDAVSGGKVTIWPIANVLHEVVCSAGITQGTGVEAADSGEVVTATIGTAAAAGSLLGICTTGCTSGAGKKARFLGRG